MSTTKLIWFGLAGLIAVAACAPAPVTSDDTVAPTATVSPVETSIEEIQDEARYKVDAAQIEALSYEFCPYSYANGLSQIGFFDVYPGSTTSDQLFAMHGDPAERRDIIRESGKDWYYPTLLGAQVRVQSDLVTGITLQRNSEESRRVREILEALGCPDLILAVDGTPHSTGEAFFTQLVYAQRGVAYQTRSFPTTVDDVVEYESYFAPVSPEAFLTIEYGEGLPEDVKLAPWDDAFDVSGSSY